MLDIDRLLELAGIKRNKPLMEMSEQEAARILGFNPGQTVTPSEIKARRNALVRRYHEGGLTPNPEKMALINAAYDVIEGGIKGSERTPPTRPQHDDKKPNKTFRDYLNTHSSLMPARTNDALPTSKPRAPKTGYHKTETGPKHIDIWA